jgi:glycosyltransferase involved in cell wall biosynthesis
VAVYLLDDGSTDATVEIAERYLGRGVVDIELLPGRDRFSRREQWSYHPFVPFFRARLSALLEHAEAHPT